MPQLLKRIIFISFLCFFCAVKAQKTSTKKESSKSTLLELEEKKIIINAYGLMNNGEDKKAYKIAHHLLKTSKTQSNLPNTNLLLAYYFNKRSLIDSSLFYTNQALKFSKSKNDSLSYRLSSLGYNLLAINNKKRGLLGESKKWHLKGIEVSQKFNETDLYYTHLHGLALIYSSLEDYNNALKLFKQCLNYKGDEELIIGSYINISDIYGILKDYEKSNWYLNRVKKICEKKNDFQAKAVIAYSLASNYLSQNRTEEAITLFNEAIQIADENELPQIAINAKLSLGIILLENKKAEEVKNIFTNALKDAIHLGYLKEQGEIYNNMKEISLLQNDYKSAYAYANKQSKIKDSIAQLQKDKEINELEVKFKTWQKEKEIRLLQIENKANTLEIKNKEEALAFLNLQKEIIKKRHENKILSLHSVYQKKAMEINSLKKDQQLKLAEIDWQKSTQKITFYSFLAVILPIIGLLFLYYQKLKTQRLLNIKEKTISEQKIMSLVKDQELKLIKATIKGQNKARTKIAKELHDSIGGNLAAIKLQLNSVTTNVDSIHNIQKQLDETYKQVRDLSHNLIPEKFNQNNFSNILEEYLKNLAEIDHLKTSFTAYPKPKIDLIANHLQIEVYKIIQELVTNTLKHARATTIDLQINHFEDKLNILFEDNGIGFDSQKKKIGIGFKNIKERLHTISGSMEIDSIINRGTIINIDISLTK